MCSLGQLINYGRFNDMLYLIRMLILPYMWSYRVQYTMLYDLRVLKFKRIFVKNFLNSNISITILDKDLLFDTYIQHVLPKASVSEFVFMP